MLKWASLILSVAVLSSMLSSCTWRTRVIVATPHDPILLMQDVRGVRIGVVGADGKIAATKGTLREGSWVTYIDPADLK
jgi:hypothetical protein